MVGEDGVRKQIIKLIDSIDEGKLDKMLTILHTASDDSDKIDEVK